MGSHYPPFGALLTELTEHLANYSLHCQELCTLGAIISRIDLLSKYRQKTAKDGRVAQDKYKSKALMTDSGQDQSPKILLSSRFLTFTT